VKEKHWIKYILSRLDLKHFEVYKGQAKENQKLPVPNCREKMQFGDLRIETPERTIVVEIESGGGIGNFLKYWPYLSGQTETRPEKDFALVHIYGMSYPTHKALWRYFRGRMPSFIVNAEFYLLDDGDAQKDAIITKIDDLIKK